MSQCTRYTIHPQALGEYHLDKHRLGEGPPVGQEPHQAQQPQAKVSSWFALIREAIKKKQINDGFLP